MISLLADHLLDSTVFALLMGQLTLCFANNRAAVRYGLWFAASVKFLIPFSAMVALGRSLRWESAPAVSLNMPRFVSETLPAVMVSDLTLPALLATAYLAPLASAPVAAVREASGLDLETALLAVWLTGCVVLLGRWTVQWLRLHAVRKASVLAPITAAIPVRYSAMVFEPGLVGIFRPILLLPAGLTAQLSPAQLALVIEHELCHWRRRDNLTAAIHMAVQLVFWFHPMVWWIGRCLVAERERACDESVLAACSDPKAYAGSILEVCRFYVRSPLVCAPGVAGANLTHRVERIMNDVKSIRLSPAKLILLATVAATALLLPLASGLLTPAAAAAVTQPAPQAAPAPAPLMVQRPTVEEPLPVRTAAVPAPKAAAAPAIKSMATASAPKETVVASAGAPAATPAPRPLPAAAPAAASMEEIVVTGKKIREFVRTRNFVRLYTAPSEFLDQIARWHEPLCVHTEGLAPAFGTFITARVKEIAAQIGAPQAQAEPCKLNLDIVFTDHPQALLDHIKTKRPELLGAHYPALRERLATVNHPVQAWYATATRDFRGQRNLDTYDAWWGAIPGLDEFGAPVYTVPGSHLRSGLTSEFASVIIVADKARIADWEIGTIADYVAMLALARMNTPDKCQQVPSIANTLVDCGDDVRTKSLSDFDMAYLKALYLTAGDAPRNLQESGISRVMLQILEKQMADRKGG